MKIIGSMQNNTRIYQVDRWRDYPICHGFGRSGCHPERYLSSSDRVAWSMPRLVQIHGAQSHWITSEQGERSLFGDALATNVGGIVCAVRTADCVPILLYDPIRRSVAAIHAGWKGLAAGVVERGVALMQGSNKASLVHLEAAVGPAICRDCYEVERPIVEALSRYDGEGRIISAPVGRYRVDLPGMVRVALIHAGLQPKLIAVSNYCTREHSTELASYRRCPQDKSRQWSYIAIH